MPDTNGWSQYEKLVLDKLDDLQDGLQALEVRQRASELRLESLRVKSGVWGLFGAAVPAAIAVAWTIMRG